MRLTPKEREELQRERKDVEKLMLWHEGGQRLFEKRAEEHRAKIAEIDAKLAEPEEWVPRHNEAFETIRETGCIEEHLNYDQKHTDKQIAFNNYFQPGTGQAEAVRDVEGPMRKIWKEAVKLGLGFEGVMRVLWDSGGRALNPKELELLCLCSPEIETVRNWNKKS